MMLSVTLKFKVWLDRRHNFVVVDESRRPQPWRTIKWGAVRRKQPKLTTQHYLCLMRDTTLSKQRIKLFLSNELTVRMYQEHFSDWKLQTGKTWILSRGRGLNIYHHHPHRRNILYSRFILLVLILERKQPKLMQINECLQFTAVKHVWLTFNFLKLFW